MGIKGAAIATGIGQMATFIGYIVVILPVAFFLSRLAGPEGVWHGFYITEIISAAASFLLYLKQWSKRKDKII